MRYTAGRRALAWNGPFVTFLALTLSLLAGLLLLRLTPLEGLLVVGLAVVGVATVIEPLAGLVAALFVGPLRAYLQAEVPQIPAQIAHVFVAVTLGVWLARGLARRDLRVPCPPLLLPLLGFLGAVLLSLWDAVDPSAYGIPELIKWVEILLLFLFVSDHLRRRRLPWLLGTLLAAGAFQGGVGVWQFVLRGDGPEHFAILGERFYRAYGTFEQPNPYAGYLALTASLATGLFAVIVQDRLANWYRDRLGRRDRHRGSTDLRTYEAGKCGTRQLLLIGVAGFLMVAALAMSWSRGAWLGFGAAVLVMTTALPRRRHWGPLLAIALAVGALGLYSTGVVPASVTARLTDFAQDVRFEDVRGVAISDANYAVTERLAHWQAALGMFREDLWTGVGFGCYEPAYGNFALINWPIALGHAHNYYLNVAAETGLIGLVPYLILWGAVFWKTWQVTRRASGLLRGLAVGLLGAWTHLSVHHLLDNLYVNNVHLHIGVLLGLLAFVIRQTDKTTDYDC